LQEQRSLGQSKSGNHEVAERAKACAREVRRAGPQAWKLDTTLDTLVRSVGQTADPPTRQALEAVLADLKSFLR